MDRKSLLPPEHGPDREALARLEADGYVELIAGYQWGPSYRTTTRGNAVANHRWTKPITRKTADRLLAEAVARAEEFNADDTRATVIARVRVFGSYLNPEKDRLGDLDLGLDIRFRRTYDRDEAFTYAQHVGTLYGDSLVDHEAWLRAEAAKAVRGRSRSISPTPENPARLGGPWHDEYQFDGLPLLPEVAQHGAADLGW
jgi:predicted nucleotidyltransferase